jgi:hypothetical protein
MSFTTYRSGGVSPPSTDGTSAYPPKAKSPAPSGVANATPPDLGGWTLPGRSVDDDDDDDDDDEDEYDSGERRSIHSAEYLLRLDILRSDVVVFVFVFVFVVVVIPRIDVIAVPDVERVRAPTRPRRGDDGFDNAIAIA